MRDATNYVPMRALLSALTFASCSRRKVTLQCCGQIPFSGDGKLKTSKSKISSKISFEKCGNFGTFLDQFSHLFQLIYHPTRTVRH